MPPPSSPPPAPFRKTAYADAEASLVLPKQRTISPASSISSLPYRPNPALSSLYASTSSAPGSVRSSGASTPSGSGSLAGSTLFSPTDGTPSSPTLNAFNGGRSEPRTIILRAFAPHVGIIASADTDTLLRARGFTAGFLELLRPFGESVAGRVTVRDSIGASRIWDDFGVRFTGVKDALSGPKLPGSGRPSLETRYNEANGSMIAGRSRFSGEQKRVGGDISQVEEVVDRHLNFAELRPQDSIANLGSSSDTQKGTPTIKSSAPPVSPFYSLYLRRLLSGLPMTPHETFSHPVACVIATSSRNPSPIEEFKRLYASTNTGDDRLPMWVNNEFLRYYVLVHDEDRDDITKSTALYEQMKRHFGLHCHLLRLRSATCVPSDDDSIRLPASEWISAGEELAQIERREISDDLEDPTPCLFESDATALRTFVRELVTQSIVPGMERLCAQWNEQVATRRRGFSGRLMSLSKRWNPLGTTRNSSSPVSALAGANSSSNYDSLQGFYRPDAPEALMRKLGDYAFMLRDFKLAQTTYDLLRTDFDNDKAWKYYAGANEMCAVAMLLNSAFSNAKSRPESLERMFEASSHSYVHRCSSPYYALRGLLLGMECLRLKGGSGVDETARWGARILEMNLVGAVGQPLVMERLANCYAQKRSYGAVGRGSRRRKRGFWNYLAADAWLRSGKSVQAEKCLEDAKLAYGFTAAEHTTSSHWMYDVLQELQEGIVAAKLEAMGIGSPTSEMGVEGHQIEEVSEALDSKHNRKSFVPESSGVFVAAGSEGSVPLSPARTRDTGADLIAANEGFE